MANFNVHFAAAIVGGTVVANIGWAAGLWGGDGMLTVIALTTIGGLLPDIDAHNSHSVRLLFNLFGLLAMVVVSTTFRGSFPWWMVVILSGVAFFVVRYGLAAYFIAFSIHRGNCHSLAVLLLAGLITASLSYRMGSDAILSWAHGICIMLGVLIHLVLDEIYAVDFAGARLKKSFGTAIKFISKENPLVGIGLWILPLFFLPFLPPLGSAWSAIQLLARGI